MCVFFIHKTRVSNEGFRPRLFVCISHTRVGYGMRALAKAICMCFSY